MSRVNQELFGIGLVIAVGVPFMMAVASCADSIKHAHAQEFSNDTFAKVSRQPSNDRLKKIWSKTAYHEKEAKYLVDNGWALDMKENANKDVQFSVEGKTIVINANSVRYDVSGDIAQLVWQLQDVVPTQTTCYKSYTNKTTHHPDVISIPCTPAHS